MILVMATHRNGMELSGSLYFAIDPEKVCSIRESKGNCIISYAETYDRRRQPIVYNLEEAGVVVEAAIEGDYDGKETLELTSVNLDDGSVETVTVQEKYVVDIRTVTLPVNGVMTTLSRVEYVPGAFVPVVLYASESIFDLVTNSPL